MMVTIANPIYDSVFKFLMEDMRVARTILSALLKKNIVKVDVRPHEYANSQRETVSMFRIDFGATIREDDGSEYLVLIEVQKTWVETETLRFRQYLGVQYERKENIIADSKEGYALPMVAVYILGHRVGDIEEPVLYVRPEAYNYYEQPVTKGLPNPFVSSLTHNSIIVQIPLLHGQINNRLDKVLSVFDQTKQDKRNQHFLKIEEGMFADDAEMHDIIHRLLMAASDPDTRMDMNVEDEYYSIIEKRDTELMLSAQELAKSKAELAKNKAELEQNKAELEQNKAELEQNKAELEQNKAELEQNKAELEQNKAELEQNKAELEQSKVELEQSKTELEQSKAELEQKDEVIRNSILALIQVGMSDEAIASALKVDANTVKKNKEM